LFISKNNPRSHLSSEKFLVQVPTLPNIQITSNINTHTVHTNLTSPTPREFLIFQYQENRFHNITTSVELKNTRSQCLQIPSNALIRSFELQKGRSRVGPNLEKQGTRFENTTKMCTEGAIRKQMLSVGRSVIESSEKHTDKIRVSRHREARSSTLFQGLIFQSVLPPEPVSPTKSTPFEGVNGW
jgi:hypothetical protein